MKKLMTLFSAVFAVAVSVLPTVTFAAKPAGGGASSAKMVGYDVSYPQCGKRLPTDHCFAIVGVNGGNAATMNSCLAAQLS